jgi:streptogramin lyase
MSQIYTLLKIMKKQVIKYLIGYYILLLQFVFLDVKCQARYIFSTYAGSTEGFKDGGRATSQFSSPEGITVDKYGNIYVTEYKSSIVRKIDKNGKVSLIAGQPMQTGYADGEALKSIINRPHGLTVDNNRNVYFCDMKNHTIRKITPKGIVSTIAGKNGESGMIDGKGQNSRFNMPEGIAINSKGELFVADTYNFTIRKIDLEGNVSTIAGKGSEAGYINGPREKSRFNMPLGIAIDRLDNIFIVDANYDLDFQGNNVIRKIDTKGNVSTFAGIFGKNGHENGNKENAIFNKPVGIAIAADGTIFIADTEADLIRKINKKGIVSTIGGQYLKEKSEIGIGNKAAFSDPQSITVAPNGDIFIADTFNNRIVIGRKVK